MKRERDIVTCTWAIVERRQNSPLAKSRSLTYVVLSCLWFSYYFCLSCMKWPKIESFYDEDDDDDDDDDDERYSSG